MLDSVFLGKEGTKIVFLISKKSKSRGCAMAEIADVRRIEKPTIATMFGSDSDLKQAVRAHEFLLGMEQQGNIILFDEWTNSIHRNPADVVAALSKLIGSVDAIIVGAGWANQLTGCVNAFLRNWYKNDHIVVYGVAIEDLKNPIHTQAAILSITELPGSEVIFDNYVGSEGCLQAAQDASRGVYPVIKLKEQKSAVRRTIAEAIEVGRSMRK